MVASVAEFDVIIVGGGIVGSVAACLFSKHFERIALIDNIEHVAWQDNDPYGLRVSAVNPGSQALLARINVWQEIETMRSFPYTSMIVWEQEGNASIEFNASETAYSSLGHIIENQVMLTALYRVLDRSKNIVRFQPQSLQELSMVGDRAILAELESGEKLSASLLIGADGQRSKVRSNIGIESCVNDYRQDGLVCNVSTELPHQNTAWQCFTTHGPLALLPLQKQLCSVVWSVSQERCAELLDLDEDQFNDQISLAFEYKLGNMRLASDRKSFKLHGAQAQRYIDHRVALVGDAAHVIHPLAGLGLNLGLEDVTCLNTLLTTSSRPLGSKRVLRMYERERKSKNMIMLNSLEAIDKLFRSQHSVVKTLRTVGVNLTDKLLPIKLLFMQRAMGLPI